MTTDVVATTQPGSEGTFSWGGMASTFGAVVGAAVLTVLPQALTVFKEYEMVVFGAVMMFTMIAMPRGLVPTLAALAVLRGRK